MRDEIEGPLASAGDGGRVDRRGDFERDGREPGGGGDAPVAFVDPGGGRDAGTPAVVVVVVAGSSGARSAGALAEIRRGDALDGGVDGGGGGGGTSGDGGERRATPMRDRWQPALKPWGFLQ